jgi:hypothetical protein
MPGAEPNFTLYDGAAGIVLALLEARQHFGDDRYGHGALRGAAAIAAAADHEENRSLYFGLAGMAVACTRCTSSWATPPQVRRRAALWTGCGLVSTGSAGA